jgi:hypothetical protein
LKVLAHTDQRTDRGGRVRVVSKLTRTAAIGIARTAMILTLGALVIGGAVELSRHRVNPLLVLGYLVVTTAVVCLAARSDRDDDRPGRGPLRRIADRSTCIPIPVRIESNTRERASRERLEEQRRRGSS